ncbi:P-loop containing nucleoside triphosphate hydrolase protein [Atractiella rhizophila]|nr:P-loop containing nucleoside triphosphate hydrolase protein [Atractiella rhizophila]
MRFVARWRVERDRGREVLDLRSEELVDEGNMVDEDVRRRGREGKKLRKKGRRWRVGDGVFVERYPASQASGGKMVQDKRLGSVTECSPDGTQVSVAFARRFDIEGRGVMISRGYDVTVYKREREALDSLEFDVANQRRLNEYYVSTHQTTNQFASAPWLTKTRLNQVSLRGTELRDLLLPPPPSATGEEVVEEVQDDNTFSSLLSENQMLHSWITRYSRPGPPLTVEGDPDLGLNESQTRAIAVSLSRRLSLIQGPPGTGKTLTIVRALKLLKVHFQVPFPILVCAPTHVAVDHLLQSCVNEGLVPLRVGRPDKIGEGAQPWSAETKRTEHRLFGVIENLKRKAEREGRELENVRRRRLEMEAEGVVSGGKSAAERLIETSLRETSKKIFNLSQTMHGEILSKIDVVCSTTWGTSALELHTVDFPLVFIDEAAMCTEPMTLIPLMKGSRQAVLIGDHMQLPAITVDGSYTHFAPRHPISDATLHLRLPKPLLLLFTNQRRPFPSQSLSSQIILPPFSSLPKTANPPYSSTTHTRKRQRAGVIRMSARADISALILGDLLMKNPELKGADMGIITPSNKGGHVGFLEDKRRLNVSLTRAKRALFVLGNQLTLKLRQNTEFWLYMRDFGDVQTWRGSRVWEEYLAWMEKRGLLLDWKESN